MAKPLSFSSLSHGELVELEVNDTNYWIDLSQEIFGGGEEGSYIQQCSVLLTL